MALVPVRMSMFARERWRRAVHSRELDPTQAWGERTWSWLAAIRAVYGESDCSMSKLRGDASRNAAERTRRGEEQLVRGRRGRRAAGDGSGAAANRVG